MGIGLGLYICKKIAEKSGGKIYFDPSYKNGASFVFSVHCKSNEVSEEEDLILKHTTSPLI